MSIFLRSTSEMQFLGDGDEVTQVAKLHLIQQNYQKQVNNILDAVR